MICSGWRLTRRARQVILAALVLLPATARASATEEVPVPEWDFLAFEMKSWGRPISSWRLLPTGSGSWTEAVSAKGAAFGEYMLVWHEVEAGRDGYEQVARHLARLPDPAPSYDDCENAMTDMPYGTIRLTRGATTIEIAYNSGCFDDDYAAFLDVLQAANRLVESWGKAGKVLRTEKPGEGG